MRVLLIDIERRCVRTERGCLEWQGAIQRGYGAIRRAGKTLRVHRIACEAAHGVAPAGKNHALHHCDNKLCVNGEHLYWGDDADNNRDRVQRGRASGGRAGATHCVNGHEFTEENTYREPRGRACKECRRDAVRRYRANRKAALA